MITTVAAVHLEAFENVEAIAAEKAAILDGLEPDGTAVLNADIEQADILSGKAEAVGAKAVSFGLQAKDYVLKDVSVSGETTVARAEVNGDPIVFKINTAGQHFAMNGLGALAAVTALGADPALAAISLGRWSPYKGRGVRELVQLDPVEPDHSIILFDDAYNANPTSVAAALDVLAATETGRGRRIAILGDMKELGPQDREMHAALAELPAMQDIDTVHCIGPLMGALYQTLHSDNRGHHVQTSDAFLRHLRTFLRSGDAVLVKGSLSMNLGQIVDAIRKMGQGDPALVTQDNE